MCNQDPDLRFGEHLAYQDKPPIEELGNNGKVKMRLLNHIFLSVLKKRSFG